MAVLWLAVRSGLHSDHSALNLRTYTALRRPHNGHAQTLEAMNRSIHPFIPVAPWDFPLAAELTARPRILF